MILNIEEERVKLIQVINSNGSNFLKFVKHDKISYSYPRINFLWHVLMQTTKYPQIESYLKNILNYFTDELLIICGDDRCTILHYMCKYPSNISLNTFEIVMERVVDINIKSVHDDALTHMLLRNPCNNHTNNILNLLIKRGIDLNIMNHNDFRILDILAYYQKELNEVTINCIMTIVDFGGKTGHSVKNNAIYDFIECYKYSSIKPAIKNETKN